jgi:hypothetical protein
MMGSCCRFGWPTYFPSQLAGKQLSTACVNSASIVGEFTSSSELPVQLWGYNKNWGAFLTLIFVMDEAEDRIKR